MEGCHIHIKWCTLELCSAQPAQMYIGALHGPIAFNTVSHILGPKLIPDPVPDPKTPVWTKCLTLPQPRELSSRVELERMGAKKVGCKLCVHEAK